MNELLPHGRNDDDNGKAPLAVNYPINILKSLESLQPNIFDEKSNVETGKEKPSEKETVSRIRPQNWKWKLNQFRLKLSKKTEFQLCFRAISRRVLKTELRIKLLGLFFGSGMKRYNIDEDYPIGNGINMNEERMERWID
ncbi:CLUMA_CG002993, isoform A [Clunio marinus]|uniref:CLUMA_CG002993, isoform A n=1 Tax=Clunio marinus TaxID=568069 RepID=A0A1J1HNX6_9DIPT|nr:CLUMA_CG002993, isoform A [Clunio marinus]